MNSYLMRMTRRRLLGALAGAAGTPFARAAGSEPASIFEIVPSAKSGITWTHDNGRSPEHWLPESMCSGCAFLD